MIVKKIACKQIVSHRLKILGIYILIKEENFILDTRDKIEDVANRWEALSQYIEKAKTCGG